MKELVGLECTVIFNMPDSKWPFPGYPAFVVVEEVDMPMVKLRGRHGAPTKWINVAIIQSITPL